MVYIINHPSKEYVGDGVYIQVHNNQVMLTTEDGISVQNTIYLDIDMVENIHRYMQKVHSKEVTDGDN